MKRTLTITFHASDNNGSFLQSYALQSVLQKKFNVENKIINLQTKEQKRLYSILRPLNSVSNIFKNAISLAHYRKLKRRKKRFCDMRNVFLQQTALCSKIEEVEDLANCADLNIVGSDQIWNTKAYDFSSAYFLPNVKTKKISYAVSSGAHARKELLKDYEKEIRQFSALGVRETSMVKMLESFEKEAQVTLDPTCLLDAEDYEILYKKEPLVKGEYIFLYSINYNEAILKTAKKISKELKMPVITVFTSYRAVHCRRYGVKVLWDSAPSEFLNLVVNAKLVLTNSFHGTVFSSVFRKDFFRVCAENEGKRIRDDRIDDFLDNLGLARSISLSTKMDCILKNIHVDYDGFEERLENLRTESIKFLQDALN